MSAVGSEGTLSNVERTALQVAWYRWQGSLPDAIPPGQPALYDGSFDALLCQCLGESEQEQLRERVKTMDGLHGMMMVRTVSLDDMLMRATGGPAHATGPAGTGQEQGAAGTHTAAREPRVLSSLPKAAIRQVVILGAGLDARAWRLSWPPGVNVFEVDSGTTEALKQRVLGPLPLRSAARHTLVVDLAQANTLGPALEGAGFDASQPVVWLAEGLIGYLSTTAARDLLSCMHTLSAPTSQLLLTCPPTPDTQRLTGQKLYHTTFEQPQETLSRVVAAGWTGAELVTGQTLGETYGVECWQAQVHAAK